jgi:hypothetical protein
LEKNIRIFVISPDDVVPERMAVAEVCRHLNDVYNGMLHIETVLWEYHPLPYKRDPQAGVNDAFENADIYIVILWNKLGSFLPGYEGVLTKTKPVTGTQYEIERALSQDAKPVFFYFKRKKQYFPENEVEKAAEQKRLLENFLERIELKKGTTKHGYHTFNNITDFKEKLFHHLIIELEKCTGIKPKKKVRIEKKRTKIIIWGLVAVIAAVWIFYTERPKTIKKVPVHITATNEKNIYIVPNESFDDMLVSSMEKLFKRQGFKIVTKRELADTIVKVRQSSDVRTHMVRGVETMQVVCEVKYRIFDKNSTLLKSQSLRQETVGFERDETAKRCFVHLAEKLLNTKGQR